MKEENKVPIIDVHRMLDERAGRPIPSRDFGVLLFGWQKHRGVKNPYKRKFLSMRDTFDFLKYAY